MPGITPANEKTQKLDFMRVFGRGNTGQRHENSPAFNSSPVASTRLSLDAIRVPGSVFSFALPLAFAAGIFFVAQTKELSSTNGMFMPFVGDLSLPGDLWAV